jgi:homogentisate 1,2-dioxygenase
MRFWKLAEAMPALARDADGDLLLFVHQGGGELFCDYGRIAYAPGDYLYLPRGTMWRLTPASQTAALVIEATGAHFTLPDKGMLGAHAVFDPAMFDTPVMDEAFRAHQDLSGEVRVNIKKRGQVSVATFPYNPLDAVGWHGDLAPVRLNVKAIRPVVSARYHLPPSAHTTFTGPNFVVATFAPRPLESDPAVLRVPFYHRNIDYDEVIFYHRGEFFSRAGITEGMLTFHPHGVHHGPQPKAVERSQERGPGGFADEVAVNIDSRRPLHPSEAARKVAVEGYDRSWLAEAPR